jgi:SpoVK/Ycf46/Vps4 family AAA+-type ATPase
LLAGDPGTGKTMTAKVLACELRLPLHTIQMDRLITKFMGESSAKLRQIFDRVREVQGVYLFDEFDAIGGDRTLDNDVGEMRRVLAAFLQFIEHDVSDNLIVAATNTPQLLDAALFRRFDDVLYYDLPSEKERSRLIVNVLGTYFDQTIDLGEAVAVSAGLSHAEIDRACRDAIKEAILKDEHKVESHSLVTMFRERHGAYLGNRGGRGE